MSDYGAGRSPVKLTCPSSAHKLRLYEGIEPGTEVVAVEEPFAVPLIDQETGEVLDRDLVGTLDLLGRDAEGIPVGARA